MAKKGKSLVLIMRSRCSFPAWGVVHIYFLTLNKGQIDRYEIAIEENPAKKKELGHLQINTRPPLEGINIFAGLDKWKWRPKLLKKVRGEEAINLTKVLKQSTDYEDKHDYNLIWRNCNTFAQRMLNKANCKFKLPKKAIGKDFA